MFFIAGNTQKLIGQETRKINKSGFLVNAEIKVYRNYMTLFFIPIIPLGKSYSIYIPHSDEYYENNYFSKMPEKYLEICREVGRKF